jgi:DNA-binding CsgD family transcriptional regulator
MATTEQGILGRDAELVELRRFVESVSEGSCALVLQGTAGIGKTTLWVAGLTAARDHGCRVLATRAAQSEARLSYTALVDLLDDVSDDALAELPVPQRRALETALLRAGAEGAAPDQRAVSLATVGVLKALGASGPVVIAVDDVQWLDTPSARVLSFAARRLGDSRVGVMVSLRLGADSTGDPLSLERAVPPKDLFRLEIGPLGEEVLGRLLRERTGADLPRPLVQRLHRVSRGNPFFALEMARAVAAAGSRVRPGELPPVPEDLDALLQARIRKLPSSARDPLLAVAAATRPTEELVLASAVRRELARAGLAAAEKAGVIEHVDERIRFTHPLLGSAVYAAASPDQKRDLHRRLAEVVPDPEEAARHLALAATKPDPDVARALDDAAHHSRARGAPDAAAELSELARQLTPVEDEEAMRRRSLGAAEYHFDAGDAPRAIALLQEAAETSPPGHGRAEILYRLSSMSWMNLERGVRAPLEQALPEASEDPELLTGIHVDLTWVAIYLGDLSAASEHSEKAIEHASAVTDPSTRSDALATLGMVEFLNGGSSQDLMSEAVELQDLAMNTVSWTEGSVYTTPRSILGLQLMWQGELDAARDLFLHELSQYERLAMYTVRQEVLCYLAELECRAGRWELAAGYAAEAAETVAESGKTATQTHVVRFNQALAAAHLGDVDTARRQAEEGVRYALQNDDLFNLSWNRAVLGFLELSRSNNEQAHEHLQPVVAFLDRMGPAGPGVIPCIPDDIEALISLGRLDEAEALLLSLEDRGRALDRPWVRAVGARCRGLLTAALGDIPAAIASLEQALVEHERVPQPFELARTLLVKGEVERRAKQRRRARSSIERSLEIFDDLGARLWVERARADLARVGGGPAQAELTPTEQRVASLVAEGKTNREVAAELFVTLKTVEANLSRVFHKMGVRSRAELIRATTLDGGALPTPPKGEDADPDA